MSKMCHICRFENENSVDNCEACGVLINTEIDEIEEVEEITDDELVVIYTCSEVYEAEMLKANLMSAGIEAFVFSQKDRNYPVSGNLSVVKVYVHLDDAEDAVNYVNSLDKENGDSENSHEEEN